jgi:hypothetical protein
MMIPVALIASAAAISVLYVPAVTSVVATAIAYIGLALVIFLATTIYYSCWVIAILSWVYLITLLVS